MTPLLYMGVVFGVMFVFIQHAQERSVKVPLLVALLCLLTMQLTGCALNKTVPQVPAADWWVYGGMAAVRAVAFWIGDRVATIAVAVVLAVAIAGCGDTINPVRYQVQEVLITKPCLAGRTPPAQAVLLTDPVCTLPPAECVRAAAADIAELQRETRESRNLIRECSK